MVSVFILSDFFQNIPLGVLSAIIIVALSPSVKNISMFYKLVQKARLDSKTLNENLITCAHIHQPDHSILSHHESLPNLENYMMEPQLETTKSRMEPLHDNLETTSTDYLNLFPQNEKSTAPSIISTTSLRSTKRLIEKFSLSTKMSEWLKIWSDLIIWSNTFMTVLLIDVSAGISLGLMLVILMSGLERLLQRP